MVRKPALADIRRDLVRCLRTHQAGEKIGLDANEEARMN